MFNSKIGGSSIKRVFWESIVGHHKKQKKNKIYKQSNQSHWEETPQKDEEPYFECNWNYKILLKDFGSNVWPLKHTKIINKKTLGHRNQVKTKQCIKFRYLAII